MKTKTEVPKHEPATLIIRAMGGITKAAVIAGVAEVTIQRWRWPVSKGGCEGFIPRWHHAKIIEHFAGRKIKVSAAIFVDYDAAKKALRKVI